MRAGLIRVARAAIPDPAELADWLRGAEEAVEAYEPERLDGAGRLRRHPAWVGVCALELGAALGEDRTARAVELASRGFAAQGGMVAAGLGEVLWAMAEAADEVGWSDLAGPLLEAAGRAPFADAENLGRVRLLLLIRDVEAGEEDVEARVAGVLSVDEADARTRVHALWIGGLADREQGRLPRALARLEEARDLIDGEAEPEVLARVRGVLRALGAEADDPGAA